MSGAMSGQGRSRGPTPAQRAAADPGHSAWVGANAGSGKTRVLTERVARLLLAGTRPERILCLTYTKAAAVEMQSRLFAMLGDWSMADDDRLAADIAALSGAEPAEADPGELARARRLFAAALEAPGGLKIETIHAFCTSLLRRFPLEAGISPRFQVLDDRDGALMLARIRREMAADAEQRDGTPFDAVAARLSDQRLDQLVSAVLHNRALFTGESDAGALRRALGLGPGEGREEIVAAALARLDWQALTAMAAEMARCGKSMAAPAEKIGRAVSLAASDPAAAAEALMTCFLTDKGEPRSRHNFPVKAVLTAMPEADALMTATIAWAADLRQRLDTVALAERSADLQRFAADLLARYAAAKSQKAVLDFADLVSLSAGLLAGSGLKAWVLYKLDRGIDHVLVDEAQDTSPEQWELIEAITGDFFAGEGQAGPGRTLFVVGDEKQSIYSFQGADPAAFGRMRGRIAERAAGGAFARPALDTSFRSAPGILALVDRHFAARRAELTAGGEAVAHVSSRAGDGARIDLWPLVEPEPRPDPPDWWLPSNIAPPERPKRRLARLIAAEIGRMIESERLPPRLSRESGEALPGRKVRPGDILVLVRSRDELAAGLIAEMKAIGVPVAGADRLKLAAGLAVKDLLALLKSAITPADELSLAAAMRSPLMGVSEDALFDLAYGRQGRLADALRDARETHPQAAALHADLAQKADLLRPYEMLERILVTHGGRQKLVARLGVEAEDLIDELLEQALAYEAHDAPTLPGFIAWIEAADLEIKREMDRGRDAVRVMTVHGAKGLEAPVVILPDTVREVGKRAPMVAPSPVRGEALWLGSAEERAPVGIAAREAAREAERAEDLRKLYVALTRAEDWLIVCGAGRAELAERDWHGALHETARAMGAAEVELTGLVDALGPILRLESGPDGAEDADAAAPQATRGEAPPAWLSPAATEARPIRRSPSSLVDHGQDAEAGGEDGAALTRRRSEAISHGLAVHALLEHLAGHGPDGRDALAEEVLDHLAPELGPMARDVAIAEAAAVLDAPFAAEVFGPESLAEAPLSLDLPSLAERPMLGRIDRLVLGDGSALVVDFKSDARPAKGPEETPEPYLVQLAAYAEALRHALPDRRVEAAILWTATPLLVRIPEPLLEAALARSARLPLAPIRAP